MSKIITTQSGAGVPIEPTGNIVSDNVQDLSSELDTRITNINTSVDGKVDENPPITPDTKTKITYDAKGLVTSGTDAVLNDLGDVTISDPQLGEVIKYNGTAWVNMDGTDLI